MTDTDLISASLIDQLLGAPETDRTDVAAAVSGAVELGLRGIWLPAAAAPGDAGPVMVTALAGFPSGNHHSLIKATEARLAVDSGAGRVAVVADLGAAIHERFDELFVDVLTVREAVGADVELTVIVEAGAILAAAGEPALAEACRRIGQAGAGGIGTATGRHPAGTGGPGAVRLIRRAVPALGVAAGPVNDADEAAALLAAGADRLISESPRRLLTGAE